MRFVCTHKSDDDRPPTGIPVYKYGHGNGTQARLAAATGDADIAGERLRWLADDSEGKPGGLVHVVEDDERWLAASEYLSAAISAKNHHQLDCLVCGFTERLDGADIERLLKWAENEGLSEIPLRSARRILQLLG